MMKIVFVVQCAPIVTAGCKGDYRFPFADTPTDFPAEVMIDMPGPLGNDGSQVYFEGSGVQMIRAFEAAANQLRLLARLHVDADSLDPQWESKR